VETVTIATAHKCATRCFVDFSVHFEQRCFFYLHFVKVRCNDAFFSANLQTHVFLLLFNCKKNACSSFS